MAGDYVSGGLSRLCCLIDDSSSRFKFEEMELSRDKEKETLIYLSKVLREFKGCIEGRGSLSEDFEEMASSGVCIDLNRGNLQCLTNRVFSLMHFLTVKSKYVQHLVGNIFVAASQLVATSGSRWGEFINLLCACLEVAISNALLNSSASFPKGNEILNFHLQGSELIIHSLENADWHTAAETLGILRRIMKVSKEELDEERVKAFISSLRLTFLKLPWKLLNGTSFYGPPGLTISRRNSEETESMILFLGYLIQLFCSLVELDVSEESRPGTEKDHTMLHMVNNVLPEISKLCLDQEETCHHTHIIPYFQHKFLILLMRLSSRLPYNCDAVSSWLHILHSYYEDLLMGPISRVNKAQDDCLESSPFLWSLCDQEKYLSSSLHLQRITIFLFLKCWLSLSDQGVSSNSNCASVRLNSVSDSNKVEVCCSRQKGILELYRWLELHVPFSLHTDNKAYIDNCINFASSFVALYIHEDDILFEVLLHLFNIVSCTDKLVLKEEDDLHELNLDAFCHIANVFNPFLLFHIFLAKINYDHHLLLDYLISKDLGIRFAEYLLRCLRNVCNSWEEFVNLPVKERVYAQQSHKKRKLSLVSLNASTDPVPTALRHKPALFRTEYEKGNASEMNCRRESFQIMKATTCMLSLKDSLIKLHRKSLFPYNPEVLLRRLKRFEELCGQYG